jgi:hypothetical protein
VKFLNRIDEIEVCPFQLVIGVHLRKFCLFKKENILISQLLHRPMHIVVPYYKQALNGPGNLKNKVLSQSDNKKMFSNTTTKKEVCC